MPPVPRRLFRIAATYVLISSLAACGTAGSYLRQSISSSTASRDIQIAGEEYRLITYSTGHAAVGLPQKTVFYIGGSGCASLRVYLAPYFSSFPSGFEIVALEKTGVGGSGFGRSCTNEFWDSYTYDELLRRNSAALSFLQQRTGSEVHAIIGTSEGGPITLELAASNPQVSKVAVIAAGGMSQREELEALAAERGGLSELKTLLSRVDADPTNRDAWILGYPHTYWSAVLDRDPRTHLPKVQQPVLLVIGANDQNVPVASARVAHELLPNSELIEWLGANHTFQTPSDNERGAVLKQVGRFVLGNETNQVTK